MIRFGFAAIALALMFAPVAAQPGAAPSMTMPGCGWTQCWKNPSGTSSFWTR